MTNVAVISCGLGNVQSLCDALKRVGSSPKVCESHSDLLSEPFDRIVLPGVGAVSYCLERLRDSKFDVALQDLVVHRKIPFLGICVGMQVLATECFEFHKSQGLNFIPGKVEKIIIKDQRNKLPHVGWNDVNYLLDSRVSSSLSGQDFYFVHSYCFNCSSDYVVAYTEHEQRFASIVSSENIFGVQFHPEKSSKNGELLLQCFVQHGQL